MVTFFFSRLVFVILLFSCVKVSVTSNAADDQPVLPRESPTDPSNVPVNRTHHLNHRLLDNSLGLKDPKKGASKSESVKFPSNTVTINKCCPWGAAFDIDNLNCGPTSEVSETGNLTVWQMEVLERKFLRSRVHNFRDLSDYRVEIAFPPCKDTNVIVGQVTTQFTCDLKGAKVEGEVIPKEYCIDERDGKGAVLVTCRSPDTVCEIKRPCIRKCQPFGEFFGKEDESILELPPMSVKFYNLHTLKVDSLVQLSHFGMYLGNPCGGYGRHKLNPEDPDDIYYLGIDGRLYVPKPEERYYTNDEFCIEYVNKENYSEVSTFLCVPPPPLNLKYDIIPIGLLISCTGLLATFIVYLCLSKTRNLYGKSLMCYVASLFFAYLTLAVIQLASYNMEFDECVIAGYVTLFFFLAAFFWLNVMSFDIWKTFRSVRSSRGNKSSKGKIHFLLYSLYAWIVPFIVTGLCAFADFVPGFVPPSLKPDFGDKCWFSKFTKGIYVFFILPVSIVIICNTALYITTAYRCWKVKAEVIRMGNQRRKKYATNKTHLMINAKLFIVMGVVWSMEVISFLFDHPIWYISDAMNALHGVFIFVIFVLKKQVIAGLPEKVKKPFIKMKGLKRTSAEASDADDATTSTKRNNFSRTSSSVISDVSSI